MDKGTQRLVDDTLNHVDAYWREHGVPMLLSTLGNIEEGRISREARHHADSLREFLEQVVGDRVMVVQHSNKPTIVGVVTKNEQAIEVQDWDPLLDRPGNKATVRRLHPAFWAAFRKPILDGMQRFIGSGEPIRFIDVALGVNIRDAVWLDPKFVSGLEASPEDVYESAMGWLRENKLDASRFLSEPEERGSTKLPSNDLLGKLILALDPRDLEKISIPMEVVAKLRRRAG